MYDADGVNKLSFFLYEVASIIWYKVFRQVGQPKPLPYSILGYCLSCPTLGQEKQVSLVTKFLGLNYLKMKNNIIFYQTNFMFNHLMSLIISLA